MFDYLTGFILLTIGIGLLAEGVRIFFMSPREYKMIGKKLNDDYEARREEQKLADRFNSLSK